MGGSGRLCLSFERRAGKTILAHSAHAMPLQILAPCRLDDPACVVSMLNPTGGLLGGDHLCIDVSVGPGAHACLTTPSATRVYRTNGPTAEQDVRLRVADGGVLEWLPDHTIPSAGSAFRQRIDVDLASDARLILVDAFAAGRVARGESWLFARLESALTIREGPRWILCDRFALAPGSGLWAPSGGTDGHPYFGTVVAIGPGDLADLARATSASLDGTGVVSAAAAGPRGGLVARVLAGDAPALLCALDRLSALVRHTMLGLGPVRLRKL